MLLGCLNLTPLIVAAQSSKTPIYVWAEPALGIGSPGCFQLPLRALVANKHELSIGFIEAYRRGSEVPANYSAFLNLSLFSAPPTFLDACILSYGYVVNLPTSDNAARFVARGGVLYGTLSDPQNFQRNTGSFFKSYYFQRKETFAAGVLLNPALQLALSRGFGLTLGAYALAAPKMWGGGFSFGMMVGHLTNRVRNPLPK